MNQRRLMIARRVGGELHAVHHFLEEKAGKFPLIILCHGFTGDKTEWGRFPYTAEQLNKAGLDAIYFDFSGSGENSREPVTLSQQIHDLEDVYAWAQNQGYRQISTIGLSFGGLTSFMAELPGRKCLVLWAPALSMAKIIRNKATPILYKLGKLLLKIKATQKIPTSIPDQAPLLIDRQFFHEIENVEVDSRLKQWKLPLLLVQGTLDEAARPEWNREAFSLIPNNGINRMIMIEGATHDFKEGHLDQFIQHSIDFFRQNM